VEGEAQRLSLPLFDMAIASISERGLRLHPVSSIVSPRGIGSACHFALRMQSPGCHQV
jgi:hypothetical protein